MAVRKHGTLSASTVATVALDGGFEAVELVNHGSDAIYFSLDGTTPTVQGDDFFVAAAGGWVVEPDSDRAGAVSVKLISAGTPSYSLAAKNPEEWVS